MPEFTRDMLFGGKKENAEGQQDNTSTIINIELDKLIDFREGQPFSIYDESQLKQMKQSIKLNGILSPIIVRSIEDSMYEIISGHNRVKCSRELELATIPANVIECDNDTATLIMLDSNLCQRDNIPPVTKGFAYKLQLETIKRITEKAVNDSDINNSEEFSQDGKNSLKELADKSNDSKSQIHRLIRLTELISPLQEKVNTNELSVLAGVELSYIGAEEQQNIISVITTNNIKITVAQAEQLRATKGELTEDEVLNVLTGKVKKPKEPKFTGKIKKPTFKKYKDRFNTDDDFDELIDKLLAEYFENQ